MYIVKQHCHNDRTGSRKISRYSFSIKRWKWWGSKIRGEVWRHRRGISNRRWGKRRAPGPPPSI